MNKFLTSIVLLIIGTTTFFAQNNVGTISGEIRDSQGTLAGASVFLVRDMKTQKIVQHTISMDNGDFTISAPVGQYSLGVSFVGYEPYAQIIQITSEDTVLKPIVLKETSQELQVVVVQGHPVHVRTQPDGFVVDVKAVREKANDALDLLKNIPRIQIKGDNLNVIGKDKVLIKIGNVLQRVESSEIASVLKGYNADLIDKVEVITQPPLRYDPDGNTAMIVLHTSSVFKEYMGGIVGTEEMWGGKNNYRFGGYGSLLYNHRGLFASIAPSVNFNGSKSLERQEYKSDKRLYKVHTPSSGDFNYKGVRANLQYEYGDKKNVGLALSLNKRTFDNKFESQEIVKESVERIVNNQNTYDSDEPRFTTTAYWETTLGNRGSQTWAELSYFNLTKDSQTDYAGHLSESDNPFLNYSENNELNTSGFNFNNDYSFYLDDEHKYLLETGIKCSWIFTDNYRNHDEKRNNVPAVKQENDIRWDELIVTPYISSTLRFNQQWWMRVGLIYAGTKSKLRQKGNSSNDIPEVSTYNNAWLPTFHASYTPASHHQFTLTFNSFIIRPQFKDLNPFEWQINENSFYRGNTNLRPQRYYTTSLGYTFRNALSIRGRIKRGLNMLAGISTMTDDKVFTQMENAQNSLFGGVEIGYYFNRLRWLNASFDGYYGRNKYTSANEFLLPEVKGNEWGVNGYLDFTFNRNRTWTGYISGDYTGRKNTTTASIDPQYDLGVGISHFMLERRLSLSLAGLNLISSKYKGISHRNGYTISFNNRYNYPTLYFSISYKFSNAKDKSKFRVYRATQDVERRF